MKKIGLIPNLDRDTDLKTTRELIDFIHKTGLFAYIDKNVANIMRYDKANVANDIYSDVDVLVILGGDGSILRAAAKTAVNNVPLIGINLGNLGYLTDVEQGQAKNAIKNVLNGRYNLEKRMMLQTTIYSEESNDKTNTKPLMLALNDIYIAKYFSKLIELNIYVNGEYIDKYRADGVIISTPTGSTAYNLAAGGPILKPDSQMIAITPICPHTLYARPFVISSNDIITIKPSVTVRGEALVFIDGQSTHEINGNSIITIRRSDYYTTILKTNGLGFYDILRLKMVGEVKR